MMDWMDGWIGRYSMGKKVQDRQEGIGQTGRYRMDWKVQERQEGKEWIAMYREVQDGMEGI